METYRATLDGLTPRHSKCKHSHQARTRFARWEGLVVCSQLTSAVLREARVAHQEELVEPSKPPRHPQHLLDQFDQHRAVVQPRIRQAAEVGFVEVLSAHARLVRMP